MTFNHPILTVLVVTITLSMFGCATAPQRPVTTKKGDYQYLQEYLSWSILKDMEKYDVKGLSIAIIDGQRTVWEKGFGLANEAEDIPASSKTIYRIGSVSKVITATEIMNLYGAEKINIDHSVSNYIKDFSVRSRFKNTKPITLRALLSHHSGLPSDILAGMWVQNPISLSELIDKIKEESLASPPQTMYKYSNIGYSVLGRVIEVVENKPFSTAMSEDLLQPLGMEYSSFKLTTQLDRFYAKGYRNGKEAERTPLRDLPAGSMLSNVEDMARFVQFVFSGKNIKNKTLIQQDVLKEMFVPQFTGLTLDFYHKVGLDWILGGLTSPIDDVIVWHNGAATPHQAHISLLPDKKLGVVILANTDEASQFITELGVKSLELAFEAKYGVDIPVSEPPKDIVPVSIDEKTLDNYSGRYVVFGDLTDIKRNGGNLEIKLWGNKLQLVPISNNTFVPKAKALGFISIPLLKFSLTFQEVDHKQVALLHGLPAPFAFQKVTEYTIPEAWLNRLGSYQTETLDEIFKINNLQLEVNNGVLLFNVTIQGKKSDSSRKLKIALRPISDTEAIVIGLANGEGGTVRVIKAGSTEKIYYSGFMFSPVIKNKLSSMN